MRINKVMKNIIEFSKKVVFLMIVMWFIASIFAMFIVWRETSMLDSFLTYVGAPVTGTLVLYMAKSAFENNAKIKCSHHEYENDHHNEANFNINYEDVEGCEK